MKDAKRIVIFFLCTMLCCTACANEENPANSCQIREINEASPMVKSLYMNGVKVEDQGVLIVFDHQVYVNTRILNQYIGNNFFNMRDQSVYIRRNAIDSAGVIQFENTPYLSLELLEKYIRIDPYYDQMGILAIYSNLPSGMNWGENYYYLTQEHSPIANETPADLTADGRGIWVKQKTIWIENDDGEMYKYSLPDWTIN